MSEPYVAPLWPAGHLPRKEGDSPSSVPRSSCNVGDLRNRGGGRISMADGWRDRSGQLISPLAGEMSGRTEGGAKGRSLAVPFS
jgi:hypothetical protein